MDNSADIKWMEKALELARKAELLGEVPVGAVITKGDELIAEGWNHPIENHDPSSHAEIEALRAAGLKQSNYRLPGTTLYVILEPCMMCVGAMIHARVSRVVYGASDPKTGALGGSIDLLEVDKPNHSFDVSSGILADESGNLLKSFFKARR